MPSGNIFTTIQNFKVKFYTPIVLLHRHKNTKLHLIMSKYDTLTTIIW